MESLPLLDTRQTAALRRFNIVFSSLRVQMCVYVIWRRDRSPLPVEGQRVGQTLPSDESFLTLSGNTHTHTHRKSNCVVGVSALTLLPVIFESELFVLFRFYLFTEMIKSPSSLRHPSPSVSPRVFLWRVRLPPLVTQRSKVKDEQLSGFIISLPYVSACM